MHCIIRCECSSVNVLGLSIQALKEKLEEAVNEARAFAAQQKADAERTKRSFSQVKTKL